MNGYNQKLYDEFTGLFHKSNFYCELYDNVTALFYPTDDDLISRYQEYFEWKSGCPVRC